MHHSRNIIAFLILCVFASCTGTTKIQRVETNQYRFSQTEHASIDSSLYKMISPYRSSLEATMNEVLAVSEQPMQKGTPEGLLGNFVADACLEQTNKLDESMEQQVDVCLLNNGGLRSVLPKGELTRGSIYELMPFENELVILELSATNFKELCNYVAYKGGEPVTGITMVVKNRNPVSIKIGGKDFSETGTYTVVTSDYLANKGDLLFLNNPLTVNTTGLKVRDAIIQHLIEMNANGKTISVSLDKRIIVYDE